jgi:hypothetical protein
MTAGRVLGGRYRLERLLASGAMGTVWQGRDLRLNRLVAVKELTGAGLMLPMAVERFDREGRALARLTHPNIVAVHDVGVDDGPYLVMELVDGPSVAALLDDGPLPPPAALAIAAQTCDGLAAAHAAGIIHRDIKPANLLLADTGLVKICDFGTAWLHDPPGESTLTGALPALGSVTYVAPEQATGGPVDARTDLYALGCTLYAMLTGAPPFTGDRHMLLDQHLTQPPPPLPGDLPPGLDALVQHLLRKAPAERPATAAEVKTRLAALVDDMTTGDTPVPEIRPNAVPAAAAAAAAALPPPPPDPRPPSPHGATAVRRWRVTVAGLIFVAAMISLASLGLAMRTPKIDEAGTGAPPATTPSGSAVPRLQPTTTTRRPVDDGDAVAPTRAAISPTSRRPTSPPEPADPVVAMRLSIAHQVDAGHLNPAKAPGLYKKVNEIAHAVIDDNGDEAAKKVGELRDRLIELHDHGTLTTAGYERLNTDLDRLAESLP